MKIPTVLRLVLEVFGNVCVGVSKPRRLCCSTLFSSHLKFKVLVIGLDHRCKFLLQICSKQGLSPNVRLSIIQTQLQRHDHEPFLDTPAGRFKPDLLAGTCMRRKEEQMRWLSGDDIVRAMRDIRTTKRSELFDTDFLRNYVYLTCIAGKKADLNSSILSEMANKSFILVLAKSSVTKRKFFELDPVDLPKTRTRSFCDQLSDIGTALLEVRGVLLARDM